VRNARLKIILSGLLALSAAALGAIDCRADSDLFQIDRPLSLTITPFASGFGSDRYGSMHEGFELEQTVTRTLNLIGRVSAYQIYQGSGFDDPLQPAARSSTRNFGRLQGGVDIIPMEGVSLILLGGRDLGDSDAPVVEGDFSAWMARHAEHPVNFSFSGTHYYENGVTSSRIDLRAILLSRGAYMLFGGAGGEIWGGGSTGNAKGEGGLDCGIFLRRWHVSIDVQVGYGSSNGYGLVDFSKSFRFEE
jgi:hypothetical protein